MDNNILTVNVKLVNEKVKFASIADGKTEIITDYIPPLGDGKSYMPLELFLISFATCVGGTITPLLRKMGKTINNFTISVTGERRLQHPTCFEKIILDINLTSPDTSDEDLQKAIKLSEDKFCPVWAMIRGNVDVTIKSNITLTQ
jgi:putative redox protein